MAFSLVNTPSAKNPPQASSQGTVARRAGTDAGAASPPPQRARASIQHSTAASVKVPARLVMRCTTYSTEVNCSGCSPHNSAQNTPTATAPSPAPSRRARRTAMAYTNSTFSRWMARLVSLNASG